MSSADNPVFKKVQATLSEFLMVPVDGIQMETIQADIKNWDSMQHINILLAMEQHFGVYFTPDDFTKLNSVEAIVKEIEAKLP